MRRAIWLAALVVIGCGGDENTPDAPRGGDARIDGPPTIDGPPGVDAMPSSVMVAVGACPGTPDFSLTTNGTPAFIEFGGVGPNNPAITIQAGNTIQFSTTGSHNFVSEASVPSQFRFRSGNLGPHTACLTFTQATPSPIDYTCQAHSFMGSTIEVN